MEEQLDPFDVQEIKFLLKDTLSSKLYNYIILMFKDKKLSCIFYPLKDKKAWNNEVPVVKTAEVSVPLSWVITG